KKKKKKTPLQFDKPDAVKGIYLTGHSAGGERFDKLVDLINNTDLNSMVIDIKDDYGNLTYEPNKNSDLADFGQAYIKEPKKEKKKIQLQFDKPDAVKGIYLTGHSAGGERFDKLVDLINNTDLNSMVIDIKDDYGNLTYEPNKNSDLADFGQAYIKEPKKVLKELEKEEIYQIARVVVFIASVLAVDDSNLSV